MASVESLVDPPRQQQTRTGHVAKLNATLTAVAATAVLVRAAVFTAHTPLAAAPARTTSRAAVLLLTVWKYRGCSFRSSTRTAVVPSVGVKLGVQTRRGRNTVSEDDEGRRCPLSKLLCQNRTPHWQGLVIFGSIETKMVVQPSMYLEE